MEKLICQDSGIEYFMPIQARTPTQRVVLLVHGAGAAYTQWQPMLKHLPAEVYSIALNLPGHGGSLPCTYSLSDIADAIADFLKANKIDKIHLIGHSLGGLLTQLFVIKFPEYVNKLVLISTDSKLSLHPSMLEQVFSQKIDKEFIAAGFQSSVQTEVIKQVTSDFEQVRVSKGRTDLFGETNLNLSEEIKKISMDTLVIMGDKDKILSPRRSRLLAANLPNSTMLVIENCGHYPHLERPQALAKAINSFIA